MYPKKKNYLKIHKNTETQNQKTKTQQILHKQNKFKIQNLN